MITDNVLDQLESVPLSSVAFARTLKVFVDPVATVQVWDALDVVPELTRDVVDVVASPQSNVYLTWSPSGSVPDAPEVEPEGTDGAAGGVFTGARPIMVTDNVLDQLEAAPFASVAIARTLNVFVEPVATVQVWDALADMPELTRDVVDVVASPQSNVYLTWSPSGSVALVE
jgi:hypothetical protein